MPFADPRSVPQRPRSITEYSQMGGRPGGGTARTRPPAGGAGRPSSGAGNGGSGPFNPGGAGRPSIPSGPFNPGRPEVKPTGVPSAGTHRTLPPQIVSDPMEEKKKMMSQGIYGTVPEAAPMVRGGMGPQMGDEAPGAQNQLMSLLGGLMQQNPGLLGGKFGSPLGGK